MLERIKNEPAVAIGVIAAAAFAGLQAAAGRELISPDLAATLERALNPEGGWLWPIIIGIVTRFFVYGPKSAEALRAEPPPGWTPPNP